MRHLSTKQVNAGSNPAWDTMKVLVTGDREWDDVTTVVNTLEQLPPDTIIVHGACRGADNTCAAVAEALGFQVRPYPADWTRYSHAAGPIRNQLMLDEEHKEDEPIDLCLAFHNNIATSKGTKDMMTRAQKAGIVTRLITSIPT